jgi:UDP-glucose 4-epimerase
MKDSPIRHTYWLITGGCGFIGTSLVKHILAENPHAEITILDNLSVGTREDLATVCDFMEVIPSEAADAQGVRLVVGDIRDFDVVVQCTQGIDCLVHLAANTGVAPSVANPRADMENNVMGTFNVLEAARIHKVKRVVFASSGAPIGEIEPPIHEELAPHPVSPYGASKLAGEGYCSAYFRTFGVETVALRFGNVYGPGSTHKNSVVARFIKQAMNGETLEVYGDGNQTRDFIYIEDLTRAILFAASVSGIGGEIFQIATNAETTVNELVDKLLPTLSQAGYQHAQVRHAVPRCGDVRRNFSDTSKALEMLGWQAEFELIEGLKRTVEWFTKR